MKLTRPELGLERLLIALERDLLDARDEEFLAAANELGMEPGMKGSVALLGVTCAIRLRRQNDMVERRNRKEAARSATRARRRPGGDSAE